MSVKVHLIAAARPNFMKVAPLYHALKETGWARPILVHTGQHYDHNMSDAILEDLRIPTPDFHLGVGSGSHAEPDENSHVCTNKLIWDNRSDEGQLFNRFNRMVSCVAYDESGQFSCMPDEP